MATELALVAVGLLLVFLYNKFKARFPPGMAHPPGLPFIGNLHRAFTNRHRWGQDVYDSKFQPWWNPEKRTFCAAYPGYQIIFVSSAAEVKHILSDNFDNYVKGEQFSMVFKEFLSTGVFAVDGAQWKKQRKIASRLFSLRMLRDIMLPAFVEHAQALIEILRATGQGEGGLEMQGLLHRFTMDSFCHIAFGVKVNSMSQPDNAFGKAFDTCNKICAGRFVTPTPVWKLMRLLNVGSERALKTAVSTVDQFIFAVIEERKQSMLAHQDDTRRSSEICTDILGLFLAEARRPQLDKAVDGDQSDGEVGEGGELSNSFLRDVTLNFILAGRDTTGWGLTVTLQLLSDPANASILKEVRAELAQEIADISNPSFKALENCHLLQAVIYEALRLFPSVPVDGKFALADDVFPTGYNIPQGAAIVYSPYALNRDEEVWGKDALLFNPRRWYSEKEQAWDFKMDPFQYTVFNAGPRTCLGKQMAIVEMSCVISMLLPLFDFSIVPGQDLQTAGGATLSYRNGLFVRSQAKKI